MTILTAPVKPFLDWTTAAAETVETTQRLVASYQQPAWQRAASSAAGERYPAAERLPGRDIQVLESAPGRANLVARLRGDGSKRPLLLSGHLDVVPVERAHWSHDPFGGEIDAGCIWGRGALDMKGFVSMYLQVFLQAFRQGTKMKRDLIFAAIADEENGFTHGSKFLVTSTAN